MVRTGIVLAFLALSAAPAAGAPYDWTQFGGNAAHSGVNADETRLGPGNVGRLRLLFQAVLPDFADGAPVFLEGVRTPKGVRDLLFLTTASGHMAAVDAHAGEIVWITQPPPGPMFTTSCPAADPSRLYVYGYSLDGYAHKYLVGDGTEVTSGGWPQLVTRKPLLEKCTPSLTIATAHDGRRFLYVTTSGFNDEGNYQGHVTTIDLASGAQKVFNASCSDFPVHFDASGLAPDGCPNVQTGIWARAGVVYEPVLDRIFFSTGNGTFDGPTAAHNWGDSVLSLSPDGAGRNGGPVDSYTPTEFQLLNDSDLDLGSTAPALLPPLPGSPFTHLAVQSGKDGKLRLLNLENLSGQGGPGHVGGDLQVLPLPQGPAGVLTAPAVWKSPDGRVFVFVGSEDGLSALELVPGAGNVPTLVARWTQSVRSTSPLVANGILYTATHNLIRALEPLTGQILWQNAQIDGIHMQSPVVANGILYISDVDHNVFAFSPDGVDPAATSTYLVPGAAHVPGQGGAFYTTDLTITNTGSADAAYTIKFLPAEKDGTLGAGRSFLLGPGKIVTYRDVVESVFERGVDFGAIQVLTSSAGVRVAAQTSSPGPGGGTFGQSLHAARPEDLVRSEPRSIAPIRENAGFRTNLILANAVSDPISVSVTLVDKGGAVVGSKSVPLLPLSMKQLGHVARDLGASGDLDDGRIVLSTSTPGGAFAAYASVIDNATNDPRGVEPW